MEKTQEMLDRAKEDNPCKRNYEEDVMYSMRDFNDEFFDWLFDFDIISNSDWNMILVTMYISPITSIVVEWSAKSWFENPEEFVDEMIRLYNHGQELLSLFKKYKWEDSTK